MAFVASGGQKQQVSLRAFSSGLGDSQQHQQHRESQAVQRYAMAQHQQPHHFSEDTKASTHDFLSLYDKGSQQVENGSSAGLSSSSLTTHDFLQPLERNGNRSTSSYRDGAPAQVSREKHTMQSRNSTPAPGERVVNLPTALPSYTAIQVPYAVPPTAMIRMAVGDHETLHRQGRGYPMATLSSREDHGSESMRGVEVAVDPEAAANARENIAYWPGARFKFGLPSDLAFPGGTPVVKSGVENGHHAMPTVAKQWAQAAQGMMEASQQPARPASEDEDEDEDSSERPKADHRKEPMSMKGEAGQRMDAKNPEMRGGTPRSKHSATEQRRRSKINDRFQMLRDLVPHSDQKRDKASFLLEVIDYIQDLQGKVRKFETAEQARHQERLKSMVWDLCKRGAAGSGDEASQVNALVFAKDLSSAGVDIKPVVVPDAATATAAAGRPTEQPSGAAPISESQQGPSRPACSLYSCVSSLDGDKENTALTAQPLAMSLRGAIPLPYALPIAPSSKPTLDPNHQFEVRPRFTETSNAERLTSAAATFIGRIDGATPPPASAGAATAASRPQPAENASKNTDHRAPTDGSAASPDPAQAFPRIQGGVINVSSVYSQGLLDTLTRALQSSGVDLSQANISVQIDLGKNAAVAAADTSAKVATTPESSAQSHQSQGRTRRPSPVAAGASEPEPPMKRPKLETHE